MTDSEVHIFLGDGPRAGEVLAVTPGPDGRVPHMVMVSDPLGASQRPGEGLGRGGATTYHLHELDEHRNVFVYRIGLPD